ncbi:MAG TPA: hypothetical protein VF763_09285 [Candidatus Limnocylindrales bacterium]
MQQPAPDFEAASRLLARRLSEAALEMDAAEPGTDDFLTAYQRSCRLRALYREVRDTWQVPAEVWQLVA